MALPRFAIVDDGFQLISSPYSSFQELVGDDQQEISPKLRNHLRKYDAFYFESRYDITPVLDLSVMYRLFKRYLAEKKRTTLWRGLMNPGSEAMQVTSHTVQGYGKRSDRKRKPVFFRNLAYPV